MNCDLRRLPGKAAGAIPLAPMQQWIKQHHNRTGARHREFRVEGRNGASGDLSHRREVQGCACGKAEEW
jgi:hypothetical protein